MTIVYVYPALAERGGVERIIAEKLNWLSSMFGYHVCLITYNQGQHALSFPLQPQVQHVDLDVRTHAQYQYSGCRRLYERWRRSRLLRQRLGSELKRLQPDAVVTTTSGEIGLLLQLKGKAALVIESHGGYHHLIDYPRLTWRHRWDLHRRYCLLKRADAVVTLTEADARRWRSGGYVVHAIPNVVHLNESGRCAALEKHRAIFVGRLAPQKGIDELAAVWQLVKQNGDDWQLHVYGSGHAGALQQAEGVSLHEPVADVFPCYQDSSVLLLTSRWEPFGLVVAEAMSCGLPVVAFDTDGPSSMITDGVDGFIVKNRSIDDFARRVRELMADHGLRQQMGQRAIEAARRYKAENVMPQWKAFFESITSKS